MGQRERFILFLVGALLGVGILWGLNSRGQPEKEAHRKVRESLSLPGMMYDYAVTKKGFYGHYVKFEKVEKLADGAQQRTVVTGGRRHYDPANGRELPEEYLWIQETYAAGTPLAEAGPVTRYAFSYADRIALKLRPGHQATEVSLQSGDVATPVAGKEGQAMLRLALWQKLPGGAPWAALPDLLRQLRGHPAVESADLVAIDWEKEAEVIRANSKQ